ncbi:MAG: TetR/AcrR family transcriptional regulator [Proteobacteria bacterium]|nr:TetR/AcrR family transcriptional regulator [Pseudomonadota bacterium]
MKQRIVKGSADLFYKYGYKRVKFSEISNHIGVTTRTMYNYFSNKSDLRKEVSRFTIDDITGKLGEVFNNRELDFFYRIDRVIEILFDECSRREAAYFVDIYRILERVKPFSLPDLDEKITALSTQLIKEGQSGGILRTDLPDEVLMYPLITLIKESIGKNQMDRTLFISSVKLVFEALLSDRGRVLYKEYKSRNSIPLESR